MASSATILLIMASQGALAPRLARSIWALGHPYSRKLGIDTPPKRGDRILAPHNRGMGSIAIVMRGMCKFDRKIMVASFLPSWLQSAPMARLGAARSCALNTASRVPIFAYAGRGHVYQRSAAGDFDWGSR